MKYLPKGTVKDLLSMPQTRLQNVSGVWLNTLSERCMKYRQNANAASPDKEALDFYLLNHLVAIIKRKHGQYGTLPPLELSIVGKYRDVLVQQHQRMFWYMLLVISRESRHLKAPVWNDPWWNPFREVSNTVHHQFWKKFVGQESMDVVYVFESSAPDTVNLGQYVKGIEYQFDHGHFSKGFGGKPWGQIARTLRKFVWGETSAEVMIDTAYTLAHNNGPMFNKGMMYDGYTHKFLRILDLQRSGQLPDAQVTSVIGISPSSAVADLVKEFHKKYPEEFLGYVDWFKVEADGSVNKYPGEKAQQKLDKQKTKSQITTQVELWPGFQVNVFNRKKAA